MNCSDPLILGEGLGKGDPINHLSYMEM